MSDHIGEAVEAAKATDFSTVELFMTSGKILVVMGSQKGVQEQLSLIDQRGERFVWLDVYSFKHKVFKPHGISVSAIELIGPSTMLSARVKAVETHAKVAAAMSGNFKDAEGVTWQDVKDADAGVLEGDADA